MKKLLLIGLISTTVHVHAQTTHHVNWGVSENPAQFSATINNGDTVMWMWTSPHPHNVTSNAGSAETFASATLTGVGQSYSKTFTVAGSNSYRCTIHSGMTGTITVQGTAGVSENHITGFSFSPNPVTDVLTVTAPQVIDRIQIFDMTGKTILDAPGLNPMSKIYMHNYNAGTYLVKVSAGTTVKSFSIVKN